MCKNVYDITKVNISQFSNKEFAVDTNVMFWSHYIRSNLTNNKQTKVYPKIITILIEKNISLITTYCNITELIHCIERNEYDIFKATNKSKINIKKYRKQKQQRNEVKVQLCITLNEIKSFYRIDECHVEEGLLFDFLGDFNNHRCDVYDYTILSYLTSHKIFNVISDDSDFITYPNINLYTANINAIDEARKLHILRT